MKIEVKPGTYDPSKLAQIVKDAEAKPAPPAPDTQKDVYIPSETRAFEPYHPQK